MQKKIYSQWEKFPWEKQPTDWVGILLKGGAAVLGVMLLVRLLAPTLG